MEGEVLIQKINPINLAIFVVPVLVLAIVLLLGFLRSDAEPASNIGASASAVLTSSSGETIGYVNFIQGPNGVLVAVEAERLVPGGHAFIIHSVGACSPDFSAAGDHFDPGESGQGFIHSSWTRRQPLGAHGGDLPNVYAAADGRVRADFFTTGITLDPGAAHTVFDSDGSAIVIHEKPDAYEQEESDTGRRIACGVIQSG